MRHDEFIGQVQNRAKRAYTDESQATYRSRVVLEMLKEATTGGTVDKIREALPDDLRSLVDAGSSGSLE